MDTLKKLISEYSTTDCRDLGSRQLTQLRDGLRKVEPCEVSSLHDGEEYIGLLRKFREAVAENDKLHGENYPRLLNSILSVGEDGLYSNNLRFIFELIQNVDDCDYANASDCTLNMRFDKVNGKIILTYNEVGFSPFNVFAITGIAEAAKNITAKKNEIGEKGIGFKSVFGVADKVLIESGWFSFELQKNNFTIPIAHYESAEFIKGTRMTLYVTPRKTTEIYNQLKSQYCTREALFSRNPLLFLNKLTTLKMYFDSFRSMEFHVTRNTKAKSTGISREDDVVISVDLRDADSSHDVKEKEEIVCTRYSYPVNYSREACQSRYGNDTLVGSEGGKDMTLQLVIPYPSYIASIGNGSIYSFLPTQLHLTVPVVCHVPFKLDASREFVDPQENSLWFKCSCRFLSELLDYAYADICKTLGIEIAKYIPGRHESLIARNNGKEKCLSNQNCFLGGHYLSLPLFCAADGKYYNSSEIVCFEPEEKVSDPLLVHDILGLKKALFIPPEGFRPQKFLIDSERDINFRLLKASLLRPDLARKGLDYLDSIDYRYDERDIAKIQELKFTDTQVVEISKHQGLLKAIQESAKISITKNMRPNFSIVSDNLIDIEQILGEDFSTSEVSRIIENYLTYCTQKCICLDIDEKQYLPCSNAIVLSKANPLSSFGFLCYAIDDSDTFAIRIQLREASKRLNECDNSDSISANKYLRELANIRATVRDSLGRGYKSYIDLILKSGADRTRFIQELIQNADDCEYPEGVIPSFTMTMDRTHIVTRYNECGFTKANVRSITAIGESTKNKLLEGNFGSIGEKGVGFKTIFASAAKVEIHSGDFNFSLSADEPTVPRILPDSGNTIGTKMDITLKPNANLPAVNPKSILELCLCLRKLKKLEINEHKITITDKDDIRSITIGKRTFLFKKFVHDFVISDQEAIAERENSMRCVSTAQQIVCYIPDGNLLNEYCLYCGLPTKHKIKIPMAIDAPFALTTSREEIEIGSWHWNDIVRSEMYAAILDVIHTLKFTEHAYVLRFLNFVPRMQGINRVYVNDIFDNEYLKGYDFLSKLKTSAILPTFERETFVPAHGSGAFRFPEVANILFRENFFGDILPSHIFDFGERDHEKELNALDVPSADFSTVFDVLEQYSERFIDELEYRQKLYEYLQTAPDEYVERIRDLAIIPVYGKRQYSLEFIPWEDNAIFVKRNATSSPDSYYILNETILTKSACEQIFRGNINEMNSDWERSHYNDVLTAKIHGNDMEEIYDYLIAEFNKGSFRKYHSFEILKGLAEFIPLKNQLGEIDDRLMFICEKPDEYFPVDVIKRKSVAAECRAFAASIGCKPLSQIHYEDLDYYKDITEDDIESLSDDYFLNWEEILRGFYRDGYLSDELLEIYGFGYIAMNNSNDDSEYAFPDEPVKDLQRLRKHVKEDYRNSPRIVKVTETRTVEKVRLPSGNTELHSMDKARDGIMQKYTPLGAHKKCFCQMCRKVKNYKFIEVNSLIREPKVYLPLLRVSLCLECSKVFESMRSSDKTYRAFLDKLKSTSIADCGEVTVPIGDRELSFTATHLAEIQEFLNQINSQP